MAQLQARVLGDARSFGASLAHDLEGTSALSIAVAFAKESALSAVNIETWCQSGRHLRLLAGTDFALTELELLRRLEKWPGSKCKIYHSIGGNHRVFHPKIYVLDKGATRVAYVGSSNLTRGGLAENIEANVRLEGPQGTPELDDVVSLYDHLFDGEFSTPIQADFELRYRELQRSMRAARTYPQIVDGSRYLQIAERLLVGEYRAKVSNRRWLLVTSPHNFDVCMRLRVWGRQHEREIRAYQPGDVFFMHIRDGRGIAAFGMFTGEPYFDQEPIWGADPRGVFPWRIRLAPLGELRTGVPTRQILEPSRANAPKHWFNGFIQQSHSLTPEDFEALRLAFEAAVRLENQLGAQ